MGDLMTAADAQAQLRYQLHSVCSVLQLKHGIALWLQGDFSLLHKPYFILGLGAGSEALQYGHINQEPVGFHESGCGC